MNGSTRFCLNIFFNLLLDAFFVNVKVITNKRLKSIILVSLKKYCVIKKEKKNAL